MKIDREHAARILSELVAIPTVNPMGREYAGATSVERPALEYIRDLFRGYDVETRFETASPIHESLRVVAPGRSSEAYTLLESHVDTVPADDWLETAFTPRIEGDTLYGRGACDDKGCLTAMILAVGETLDRGLQPPLPVILLAAGDEEYAQTGIRSFARSAPPLARAVFGEPTRLHPVLRHKGTIRWDIVVTGRSAHSSQPELGRDAIQGAFQVLEILRDHQRDLQETYRDDLLTGPTLTVTMIRGGRTRNAIADECVLCVDFRVIPGMEWMSARDKVIERVESVASDRASPLGKLEVSVSHRPTQLMTPTLKTDPKNSFSRDVLRLCRLATEKPDLDFVGAPYGTDAAWVTDLCPAVVLGPGSIDYAHAINERIEIDEVVRCARLYFDIIHGEPARE